MMDVCASPWGGLGQMQSLNQEVRVGIARQLPGDADVAGRGATV